MYPDQRDSLIQGSTQAEQSYLKANAARNIGMANASRPPSDQAGVSSQVMRVLQLSREIRAGSYELRNSLGLYEDGPSASIPSPSMPEGARITLIDALAAIENELRMINGNVITIHQHLNS